MDVKRKRMETWQAAIAAFDAMAVDAKPPLEASQIVEWALQRKVPRPERVVLETGNPALQRLLASFNFAVRSSAPYPFMADWRVFAELARQGEIVKRWLAQKGTAIPDKLP